MNHKICFLLSFVVLTACGVELKSKDQPSSSTATQKIFQVDRQFVLPDTSSQPGQVIYHYDRLVLSRGAVFVTNGANVRLEIGELFADHATIQTFADGATAATGKGGRNGGSLQIVVGSASGDLTIEMRGENGGQGSPGAPPDSGMRGQDGTDGRSCMFVDSLNPPRLNPENGGKGGTGLPGNSGGTGQNGGDSGNLNFLVQNDLGLSLQVNRIPGQGGMGGVGGAGGVGGFGGHPGATINPTTGATCGNIIASPGPQGDQGPQGKTGNPGNPGGVQDACWVIGSQAPGCNVL